MPSAAIAGKALFILTDHRTRKHQPGSPETMVSPTNREQETGRIETAAIEAKWQARWAEDRLYETPDSSDKPNWYSLTMYPYPSGILHVGHWYAFVAPDAFARFKRRQGFNVLFPMGFDSFGLPAENAAIRSNVHPSISTNQNIAHMRTQYAHMGASIDWGREISTCEPEFYRWNQWIFLKMLERGLAYRKAGSVWWCPVDQTVLANEQVLEGSICERCGSEVYKRDLEQWYFKITEYAEELLAGLDTVDWPERVKTMQRNWIGRSEGARLFFRVETGESLEVFTTRPDTVWGATFMVLAPEHPLVPQIATEERRSEVEEYIDQARRQSEIERMSTDAARPRTGIFTGAYAINPVNDERIPIWIADYVLMGYGTGAIMAVPYGDQRDFEFARQFGLPIQAIVKPADGSPVDPQLRSEAYYGPGEIINSGPFSGRDTPEVIPDVITWLESEGRGRGEVTFRLRDWLISRQRYWGTPIPVIYCDEHGIVRVPEADLPVVLPTDAPFKPTGQSPLVTHESFLNAPCPICGKPARRETDTMDTFVDSSWYWFRYLDPLNDSLPFDPERIKAWTPVDLYTGGIEHAILHLLYARFFTRVLRDFRLVDHDEPFLRLRNQGIILSEEGVKMSKSRGTQVNPDPIVAEHGADTMRLHLMFLGPWDQGGPWNDRGLNGMSRFLRRVYDLVQVTADSEPAEIEVAERAAILRLTHRTIKRVTADLAEFQFNTQIAAMIELTNELMRHRDSELPRTPEWRFAVSTIVSLLAPSAPHLGEEMWEKLGYPYSVHTTPWPDFDESLTIDAVVEIAVQVNGKARDRIEVPNDASEELVRERALASERVQHHLGGRAPKKVIFVPGRLINIVG
jgi:leucyl-tRNA synthetase